MSNICPICHKHFTPPKRWGKAVCPGCYTPPDRLVKITKKEKDTLKDLIEDISEYYVVFTADPPRKLAQVKGLAAARELARAIYIGKVENFDYLKGSDKIRVWSVEKFDKEKNPMGKQ